MVDLLVLGGGMAGLAAAARAAQDGASVVLVEKAPAVGGTSAYAGFLWTAPTVEVMREVNPGGDPALGAHLVEAYPDAMDWVRALGIEVKDPVTVLGYGRGSQTDMAALLSSCERVVREADGGEVLVSASVDRLLVDDGRVAGAEVVTSSGERRVISAWSTLLATGGFGGDPDLRSRLIHPLARDIPLRSNPWSRGDGLRLGEAAGAAFGKDGAGFYGHLVAARAPARDPHELLEMTFYHSEHGVLLNLDGRRFVDETVGDHLSTLAVLEQPEARALLVCDQRVHDDWMMKPYVEGVDPIDRFALAYRRGARCAVAEDLDEFEYLPDEWGYPGAEARESLYEFNRGCEGGAPDPPRRLDAEPLVDPPYYVIEVIPAITTTFAGLLIDDRARVLGSDGTPIPGLLAAGGDAGGLWFRAYAGGAATALVFGLQAARTALKAQRPARNEAITSVTPGSSVA